MTDGPIGPEGREPEPWAPTWDATPAGDAVPVTPIPTIDESTDARAVLEELRRWLQQGVFSAPLQTDPAFGEVPLTGGSDSGFQPDPNFGAVPLFGSSEPEQPSFDAPSFEAPPLEIPVADASVFEPPVFEPPATSDVHPLATEPPAFLAPTQAEPPDSAPRATEFSPAELSAPSIPGWVEPDPALVDTNMGGWKPPQIIFEDAPPPSIPPAPLAPPVLGQGASASSYAQLPPPSFGQGAPLPPPPATALPRTGVLPSLEDLARLPPPFGVEPVKDLPPPMAITSAVPLAPSPLGGLATPVPPADLAPGRRLLDDPFADEEFPEG